MHWKCSEIFWGKYTVVYWVQFWDLFLDQLNGKILKMAYFWVSIGVENLEKMCAWKTLWLLFCSLFLPLLKMVLLFKLTLIELQDFWLHLKPPFFSFLFAKVIGFSHENCWQEKKKTFVPWEKLMENYYNCIGVSSIENWKMSSWICSTWKIDGKNDFMPDSLFLGVLIDQISFSSFFSNIFRDSFTLEKVFPPQLSILLIYSTSLFAHFYPYYTENPDALMQSKAPPPEDRL